VVALAPRQLAGLVPADSEAGDPFAAPAWSSTFVTVPGPALRDLLSGADLSATHSRGRHILPAGEVLRGFPVGLLTCEDPRHA
jgi:maltooligosyltrehalose synthase